MRNRNQTCDRRTSSTKCHKIIQKILKMSKNEAIDDDGDDLHATYATESCIYYYYNLSNLNFIVDSSTQKCSQIQSHSNGTHPTNTSTFIDNEATVDRYPSHSFNSNYLKELDVIVKYATTTVGRHLVIIDDNIDDTGIMLWPATHLLCQYLTMKLSLRNKSNIIVNKKQRQHSYLPSLVPIVADYDDDYDGDKHDIMKKFFQFNRPIMCSSNNDNKTKNSKWSSNEHRNVLQEENENATLHCNDYDAKNEIAEIDKKQVCRIVELGCGCGLVGAVLTTAIGKAISVAAGASSSSFTSSCSMNKDDTSCDYLYVSTDMNCTALDLCYTNYKLNNISVQSSYHKDSVHSSSIRHEKSIERIRELNHNDVATIKDGDSATANTTTVWIRQVCWGDDTHIRNLQRDVHDWMIHTIDKNTEMSISPATAHAVKSDVAGFDRFPRRDELESLSSFDYVFGADIVYPSTNGVVLDLLFQTVDQLLKGHCTNGLKVDNDCDTGKKIRHVKVREDEGLFVLSFCTRDGYKTPVRLLQAATEYNFALIQSMSMNRTIQKQYFPKLPPLLDAQILIFKRQYNQNITKIINQQSIGHTTTCPIFPGLIMKQQKAEHDAKNASAMTMEDLFDELPSVYSDDDDDDNDG
jgi:hypothetical protein